MATVTPVIEPRARSVIILWEGLGNDDQGIASHYMAFADRSVQVVGTPGGATTTIQGSNDGTNWVTLTDPQGNALTFVGTTGLEAISEITAYVRPITAGGAGTDVDVYLVAARGAG